MNKHFKNFRYWLAYAIAPDLIDDLRDRLSALLHYTTGGMLSKTGYTIEGMEFAVDNYQQRMCEECQKRMTNE